MKFIRWVATHIDLFLLRKEWEFNLHIHGEIQKITTDYFFYHFGEAEAYRQAQILVAPLQPLYARSCHRAHKIRARLERNRGLLPLDMAAKVNLALSHYWIERLEGNARHYEEWWEENWEVADDL